MPDLAHRLASYRAELDLYAAALARDHGICPDCRGACWLPCGGQVEGCRTCHGTGLVLPEGVRGWGLNVLPREV